MFWKSSSFIPSPSSLTISGTTGDEGGIGIKHVYYTTDGTTPTTASTRITPAANGNWSASATITGDEGDRTIKYIAEDKLGNISSVGTGTFLFDTAIPEIDETGINTEDTVIKNSSFTLSGKAKDTYELASGTDAVTISDGTHTWNVSVSNSADSNGYRTWSKKFFVSTSTTETGYNAADVIPDGLNQKFTITAKDAADKVSTAVTRTITVDTTKPIGNVTSEVTKEDTKANSFTFRGTASDGAAGSGIKEVWLTIEDAAGGSNNSIKATGTENWAATVDFVGNVFATEGNKLLKLEVIDNYGHKTEYQKHYIYETNCLFPSHGSRLPAADGKEYP